MRLRLIRKRSIWLPTWLGWICLMSMSLLVAWLVVPSFHGFLAVTDRADAEVLVVEGWVPDYALERAAEEFVEGGYALVVTSGGPLDRGSLVADFGTYADYAAAVLKRLEIPQRSIMAAPAPDTLRHRTFQSAQAVKRRIRALEVSPEAINVLTLGVHARRTWTVYRRRFGDGVSVGVVAVPSRDYRSKRWWASSQGCKAVLTEGIGWLFEAVLRSGRGSQP